MNTDWIHFLATVMWGTYGIAIGLVVVVNNYTGFWPFTSIIVAIVGNSAHLVTFAWSKGKFTASSKQG